MVTSMEMATLNGGEAEAEHAVEEGLEREEGAQYKPAMLSLMLKSHQDTLIALQAIRSS